MSKVGCVAFICVENAGRSQMAAAFARREKKRRGFPIDIKSGGTAPAENVHGHVVRAMEEKGFDLSDNKPRMIGPGELDNCDYVITMGCSAEGVCPATWEGVKEEWNLDDPGKAELEKVREIRDEIESKVILLMDEITKNQES